MRNNSINEVERVKRIIKMRIIEKLFPKVLKTAEEKMKVAEVDEHQIFPLASSETFKVHN